MVAKLLLLYSLNKVTIFATFFVFVTGCTSVRHLAISRFDHFHGKSAFEAKHDGYTWAGNKGHHALKMRKSAHG